MSSMQPGARALQRQYTHPYPGCGVSPFSSLELKASPNPFSVLADPLRGLRNWLLFLFGIGIPFIFVLEWIWAVEYGRWQIYQEACNRNYGDWTQEGEFEWMKPYVIDPSYRELRLPPRPRQIPVGNKHAFE